MRKLFVTVLPASLLLAFLTMGLSTCGGGGGGSDNSPPPPAGAFSQADLTGTWKLQALDTNSSGTENRWYRVTATVDASGNLTFTSFESSDVSFLVPPAGTVRWTIDGSGVVSESGSWAIPSVHMTMTSNKNFMAGTAGNTFHELRIAQKIVPGTVYGNADLQNKSFVIHGLFVGAENAWNHQDGGTDASGMISLANDWTPSGNQGAAANIGTIAVGGSGTVTIDTVPGFEGFLSPDKKTIVGTSTETEGASTSYQLMIIQISGQTYAASDLVGTEKGHNLGVGNQNFWVHFTATIVAGGGITFSSYLDSFGVTTAPSGVTASISSSGTLTVTDPSSQFHGTMSDDKKFSVATMTSGPGIYLLSITTR